jgi:hypothetical protein
LNQAVPAWARLANIVTTLNGIYEASGPNGQILLRTKVGALLGYNQSLTGLGTNVRSSFAWTDQINVTSVAGTTVPYGIQASRPNGQTIRFDTQCVASFNVTWVP